MLAPETHGMSQPFGTKWWGPVTGSGEEKKKKQQKTKKQNTLSASSVMPRLGVNTADWTAGLKRRHNPVWILLFDRDFGVEGKKHLSKVRILAHIFSLQTFNIFPLHWQKTFFFASTYVDELILHCIPIYLTLLPSVLECWTKDEDKVSGERKKN